MNRSPEPEAKRHARWVAMWRDAIRTSPLAISLVDLSTTCFLEVSDRAAQLFGTTPAEAVGVSYLSVAERPEEAAQTFRLARDRALDGLKGHRRFPGSDGSAVETEVSGWAIRSTTGPDLGLLLATESAAHDHGPIAVEDLAPTVSAMAVVAELDRAEVTLDRQWRITRVDSTSGTVVGWPPDELVFESILELTHREDLGALLFAFARATTDPSADVRVRLRDPDRNWRPTHLAVTLVVAEHDAPSYAVVVASAVDAVLPAGDVSQLVGHLRRIASQIETAGILSPVMTMAALGIPASADLSPRQWEIAARLVQGERVPTIAAQLFLSQSTVRNHLSAIYQKFGVHSQPELLALWRARARDGASTDRPDHAPRMSSELTRVEKAVEDTDGEKR